MVVVVIVVVKQAVCEEEWMLCYLLRKNPKSRATPRPQSLTSATVERRTGRRTSTGWALIRRGTNFHSELAGQGAGLFGGTIYALRLARPSKTPGDSYPPARPPALALARSLARSPKSLLCLACTVVWAPSTASQLHPPINPNVGRRN